MSAELPPPDSERDRAVVLVHGAWVGEWCWSPIEPIIRDAGRSVHSVSLTGHGTRRHEMGSHVTLSDHVDDVVGVIETLDLTNITLVGHSYGGRVVGQAAARVADRISSLVFLDAHAPVAEDPGLPEAWITMAAENDGMIPFNGYDPDPAILGGPAGFDWFMERTTAQSLACFAEPWQVDLPVAAAKTFIFATDNQPSRFERYAVACRENPEWQYHELHGPHFLMLSHPEQVAELVLNA